MEYWQLLRNHLGGQLVIMPSSLGVVMKDDQVLMVYHKDLKQWGFPGGIQNLNESIVDTVQREIAEELNLSLNASSLVGIYSAPEWHHSFSNGDRVQNLSFLFLMENKGMVGDQIVIQSEEIEAWDYFDLNQIPENCSLLTKQQCQDLLAFNGHVFIR